MNRETFRKSMLAGGAGEDDIPYLWGVWQKVNPDHDPEIKRWRHNSGHDFIFGDGDDLESVWGRDETILWSSGEPLLLSGQDGVGKTTIAQQLAIARLRGSSLFGYSVKQETRKVVYVAADRPKQARRSWRRMISSDAPELEGLVVLSGGMAITDCLDAAMELDAGTMVIDTLSAVAPGDLGTDAVGLEIYHELQKLVFNGVEVLVVHHNRKTGYEFRGHQEVHGSRWITAPCGSIIMLGGKPGEEDIYLRQVKPPANRCPNMRIYHDHSRGKSHATPENP